jgi:hypothetical protein
MKSEKRAKLSRRKAMSLSEATAGTFKHTVFAMQLSKEKCQAIQTP